VHVAFYFQLGVNIVPLGAIDTEYLLKFPTRDNKIIAHVQLYDVGVAILSLCVGSSIGVW
jgi:hypothetical protein